MAKHSPQHLKALQNRKPRPEQTPKFIPASKLPRPLSDEEIAWVRSMVIYEDAEIMGFNKPSGLSSQGGRGGANNLDDMMWAFAKSNGKRPKLIHRLDRETSGILLVGKTTPVASFLGKAMIRRAFAKTYLAIVSNAANLADTGTIDAPLRREEIGRDAYSRVCDAGHPDAQEARTHYQVLSRSGDAALLRCSPFTGRMHQIRVHLAHLGCPIAGDARYGGALVLETTPVPRLMLHALNLTFPHPAGGEKTLSAPVPQDMLTVMDALNLHT